MKKQRALLRYLLQQQRIRSKFPNFEYKTGVTLSTLSTIFPRLSRFRQLREQEPRRHHERTDENAASSKCIELLCMVNTRRNWPGLFPDLRQSCVTLTANFASAVNFVPCRLTSKTGRDVVNACTGDFNFAKLPRA